LRLSHKTQVAEEVVHDDPAATEGLARLETWSNQNDGIWLSVNNTSALAPSGATDPGGNTPLRVFAPECKQPIIWGIV
jgi:hypothetical protein